MNIVICCTLNASSHSKQFQILAEDLVKEGHTVIFVSDKQRTQESDYNNLTFLHWPNYTPTKLQDFFFIYKLLKKFKTDVLFTNFSAVNLSLLAAYLVGVKKRIAWLRSVSIDGYSLIGMLKRFRKSLIYGFGTEIVIVSKAILKELKLEYLINKNKVQLIPNAVETLNKNHILGLRQRRNYITCVATLEYWKGHDILINAFRKICCHYPHFELLIIGSGSREKELEGLIEKHNLKESVFLLGQLHPEDLYHYLQLSLFSVLPSRRDATPKVILESMRFGSQIACEYPLPCLLSRQ